MHKLSISFLLLFLAGLGYSQQSSLLWKIEGKKLKKPSYVFGTIHMIPQKDYFEPKGMVEALENSELFVGELNLSDSTSLGLEMLLGMTMQNDTTLDMLLSAEDYKKLDSIFIARLGMGVDLFKNFKPMLLTTMLMPLAGGDSITSYEMELLKKANAEGIPMAGLETVTEQMSFMDKLPYKYQVQELLKVMNEVLDETGYEDLIKAFKSQDIELLAKEITKQSGETMIMETVFLRDRNLKWIPKIEELISDKSCFIAVGAGHLGGKEGVINLLKAKGYKLTPIR